MGQCQTLLGDTRRGWARARGPTFPLRDSWQVCPFLIRHSKDPLKVSKLLESLSEALGDLMPQASQLENGYPITARLHLEKTGTGIGASQRWVLGPLWA